MSDAPGRAYKRLGRRLSLPDLEVDLVCDGTDRILHLWRASAALFARPRDWLPAPSGWTASGRTAFEGPAVAGEDLLAVLDAHSGRPRSREGAGSERVSLATPCPLEASLGITFCAAIAAHQLGEPHGRISPLTVLLGHDGRVELAPRLLAELCDDGLTSMLSDVSRRFEVRARYLSPEVAAGRRVDRRSDVFSLGCMLYELCTGLDPLPGATAFERIVRSLGGRADLRAPGTGYPEPVAAVVARAVHANPDERFQSPIELARAVRKAAASVGADASALAVRRLMERLFAHELSVRSTFPRPDALSVTSFFCVPIEMALAAALPDTPPPFPIDAPTTTAITCAA